MDGTSFSGNSAADGGGIFNSAVSLDLNNDSIYDNQASAYGGGLYNEGPITQARISARRPW